MFTQTIGTTKKHGMSHITNKSSTKHYEQEIKQAKALKKISVTIFCSKDTKQSEICNTNNIIHGVSYILIISIIDIDCKAFSVTKLLHPQRLYNHPCCYLHFFHFNNTLVVIVHLCCLQFYFFVNIKMILSCSFL